MGSPYIQARLSQIGDLMSFGIIQLDYEEVLAKHYRRWIQPGDTVIDVGAHLGLHLSRFIELAGPTGQVIGFEPLPFAFDILSTQHACPTLTLNNVALAHEPAHAEFTFAQGSPGESGLRKRLYISPETVTPTLIPVKVDTLDMHTENLRSVDYIKIDIEGGEIGCLEGATRTIDKFRPLISTEYGYPSYSVYGLTKDSLFNFASSKNYVLFDIFLNRIDTRDEWHIVCDSICWDYFLVPAEKLDVFTERVARRAF
ncbi:FkbM family methyltransferase [Burkholderia thailandensis]|uniref:FkbM family methyltransferase n=1 Tax=Burkholderia thailandensis TaxID=57975 RepID=UPI00031CB22D|nr:FkbM family methyltransferase [Burkholderia thailandensis]MCS3391301.1 FkbM family methyltransferase [Burkholderia thailandensis]MCS6423991.1 FkbM family methyltransferase [Burkholderia thailandensis]MCS6452126.1 FkbM family methyltransferase [Burkholderia thailandensis]MCS6463548.1 FkbM family methyltransferase [Burkholderia thailandensis]MCS6481239.1 FkbM family methyltransferase [Burkholderia thailandensis]